MNVYRSHAHTDCLCPVRGQDMVAFSHRPVPMLRDAYMEAVRAEPTAVVSRVLSSGTNRDIAMAKSGRFSVDRLLVWCERMFREGTARRYDNSGKHFNGGRASSSWEAADLEARTVARAHSASLPWRTLFLLSMRQNDSTASASAAGGASSAPATSPHAKAEVSVHSSGQAPRAVHSRQTAALFFRLVERHRPIFATVSTFSPLRSPQHPTLLTT